MACGRSQAIEYTAAVGYDGLVKAVAWIVVGVVVGFLLGGLGPRRELADAKAQISDLESRVAVAEKKASNRTSQGFLGFPAIPEIPRAAPKVSATPRDPNASPEPSPSGSPFDRMAAFDLAADAQRARAKQSRTALSEAAKLNRKQEDKVDDVIAKMNEQLSKYAAQMASLSTRLNEGQDPDPVELLTLTKDVSGILLESQNSLQEATGNPQGVDPSSSQVWNYVDLNIFKDVVQNLPEGSGPR